jgi:DNA-binding XRE family transcriptional regulator
MTKVQFIKTEGGEELAVLTKAEYQRLAALAADEDIGTARLVGKARAAIAAGKEVVLPKAVVNRLAASENPLRVLREWLGLTQAELAANEIVGITQGYLSDLEAGKRKGPVALYQKIARALGVPIELLLPIAISDEEANRPRIAHNKQVIQNMKRQRRRG